MHPLRKFIFFLITIEIALAIYLIYIGNSDSGFCLTGSGCNIVRDSQYSHLLGLSLSWFGLLAFSILLISYLLVHYKKLPHRLHIVFVVGGLAFAAYFLCLQVFVIGALCSTCLTIDSIMILIFILSLYELRIIKKYYNPFY